MGEEEIALSYNDGFMCAETAGAVLWAGVPGKGKAFFCFVNNLLNVAAPKGSAVCRLK